MSTVESLRVELFLQDLRDLLKYHEASIGVCWCEGVDNPTLCFDVEYLKHGNRRVGHNLLPYSIIDEDIVEVLKKLRKGEYSVGEL